MGACRMVTLRVHLDRVVTDNAPLLTALSHRRGRVSVADMSSAVEKCGTFGCLAKAGGKGVVHRPLAMACPLGSTPTRYLPAPPPRFPAICANSSASARKNGVSEHAILTTRSDFMRRPAALRNAAVKSLGQRMFARFEGARAMRLGFRYGAYTTRDGTTRRCLCPSALPVSAGTAPTRMNRIRNSRLVSA